MAELFGEIWFPLIVTLLAGLSTVLGAVMIFFTDGHNEKFMSAALGFSAGVMIYVSFMDLMPEAVNYISNNYGDKKSQLIMLGGFLAGMLLIAIIDKLVPEDTNPHNVRSEEEVEEAIEWSHICNEECTPENCEYQKCQKMEKLGVMTALGIAVHNFPEGLATFMSALVSPELGISIAIAIALHNIPEGIAVAVPFQYTGSRKRAIWLTFLSGFAEPIGGLIGYFILRPFINHTVMGIIFALVSGIMVYISLDELLPASREYGEEHLSIYGIIAGMMIMAVSMIFLD